MNSIREDLKAYIDGELDSQRMAEVQAAVDADPALQLEVEFMRMLGFEIKKMAAEPAVSGRAKAMEAVNRPRKARWSWNSYPARLAVACGAMAIAAAVLFPMFSKTPNAARFETGMASAPAAEMDAAGGETAKRQWQEEKAMQAPGAAGSARPQDSSAATPAQPLNSSVAPELMQRMIIKTANLGLRVPDVKSAVNDTTKLVAAMGGFVTQSGSTTVPNQPASAQMVLRVPSSRFEATVTALRNYGEVESESTSGDDVTAQYADTNARLKVMRAEEDSLITMLRAARRVSEMLSIKERLANVRAEIDSLSAQAKALKDLSSLSTINVSFEEKPKVGAKDDKNSDPFGEAWANAVNGLNAALQFAGRAIIFLFVYSPIWLPIVVIAWWLNRRSRMA
jgi:anti-sigma factor RsiW